MDGQTVDGAADNPILVLGLGIGEEPDARLVALAAGADVLAGGGRLLERFASHPGERVFLRAPLSEALDRLDTARREGKRVAVLADGDPLFFGIGERLAARFGPESLRVTPGVTAVAAAAARAGLAWQDLPAVSLHGRDDPGPLLHALAWKGRAAVHTGGADGPAALSRLLADHCLADARLAVFEDMGAPTQRVRSMAASEAAAMDFSPLNLVFVQTPDGVGGPPVMGRPDDFYEKSAGLITKWPMRAMALAALRLGPGMTLWDVGAGSGSVAIEACVLIGPGLAVALEKNPERAAMIRRNVRRAGAWQTLAVTGEAPGAYACLPDPDRVFLGGSLGAGDESLGEACSRLKPGGRMALNTVLLGSLERARSHFAKLGWPVSITQVQAGIGAATAGDVRLAAQNPVFIMAADKPA
jgi:precorrin-6Y C5,15-methyltransferase (decarboxylating)